jgi:hypothetical protein
MAEIAALRSYILCWKGVKRERQLRIAFLVGCDIVAGKKHGGKAVFA